MPLSNIRVHAVWECGEGQTDTQTAVTNIHFTSATPHAKCNYTGAISTLPAPLPPPSTTFQRLFSTSTWVGQFPNGFNHTLVLEDNLCVKTSRVFHRPNDIPITIKPTVSEHWRKLNSIDVSQGKSSTIASCFLHPPRGRRMGAFTPMSVPSTLLRRRVNWPAGIVCRTRSSVASQSWSTLRSCSRGYILRGNWTETWSWTRQPPGLSTCT